MLKNTKTSFFLNSFIVSISHPTHRVSKKMSKDDVQKSFSI